MHPWPSPRGWVASERKKRERSSAFLGDRPARGGGAEKAMICAMLFAIARGDCKSLGKERKRVAPDEPRQMNNFEF